jgi:NADH-quinone oxidoreductase subunit M
MENLLTIAVLLPLAGAFLLFLFPANKPQTIRTFAIAVTGVSLALILTLFVNFNRAEAGYQFVKGWEWFSLGGAPVSLKLGVDGISIVLLLLVGIVSFCGVLVSHEIHERQKEYYILFLALTTGIAGTFTAVDLFFFYFFYEMAVIPMYLLIGIWGSLPPGKHGRTKEYATMKLTLYLTAGAVLALLGLLTIYVARGTFDIEALRSSLSGRPFSPATQVVLFPLVLFGFGFLASLWPFHTWSPLGYAAAPTAASMMHAGVLKKLGAYGIIRVGLTLLPQGASTPIGEGAVLLKRHAAAMGDVPVVSGLFQCSVSCLSAFQFTWGEVLAVLCIFNILYAGWAAMQQKDWKFIVGYSSVSHMGYVMLGIATLNTIGVSGAVFLMFAHGLMAALSFSLIGWFYHQAHTRMVADLGGLAKKMPFVAVAMVMAAMASSGLPGFANFVSEIMVFVGAWREQTLVFQVATICAVWGIVVTATYLLRAVRSTFFGPMNAKWERLEDATSAWRRLPYALLIAVLLVFGFFPRLATDPIRTSVATFVEDNRTLRGSVTPPQSSEAKAELAKHVNQAGNSETARMETLQPSAPDFNK